ncbi:MAG: sigma-70 family RNA polymerase sigma factor [Wenzhouxiangellaceae bacterium]|nr:sigma-70 family RNA polymerase sigma factor [Wenzhouxiangellaceae bacterium]
MGERPQEPIPEAPGDVTALLNRYRAGDTGALDQLFTLAYQQLRGLARQRMVGSSGVLTINPTGLVHETYLRLAGPAASDLKDSRHFFAVAARAMRQIVIDLARRRGSAKRGGGAINLSLECHALPVEDQAEQLCELDQQLNRLATRDPRLVQVIECRFFAGLNERETAEALAISVSTVQRDWIRARAWFALHCQPDRPRNDPVAH